MRRHASGRSCFHHRIFGPWLKLGGPPALRTISAPASFCMRAIHGEQRVSSQESYGVTCLPSSPTPMIPAIWPSMASAFDRVPLPAAFAAHSAITSQVDRTWRSGSSSTASADGMEQLRLAEGLAEAAAAQRRRRPP